MTYIEYLNQFHRWRENSNPGDKVIVLYLNMLDMFNQRYWPEWMGVTTQQLMILANTDNKKSTLTARDKLVRAGFLEYRPGKKGKATVYKLLNLRGENDTGNKNGYGFAPENDTENYTENDTENDTENALILIKTKTKTPTQTLSSSSFSKTTTPTTTGEAVTSDLSLSSSETAYRKVIREFLDFIPEASIETRQQIKEYCLSLGAEVCLRSIQTARNAAPIAKNKLAYLFGILRNREADGIRSGEAWDAHERERSRRNRDTPGRNPPSYRPQNADVFSAALETDIFNAVAHDGGDIYDD